MNDAELLAALNGIDPMARWPLWLLLIACAGLCLFCLIKAIRTFYRAWCLHRHMQVVAHWQQQPGSSEQRMQQFCVWLRRWCLTQWPRRQLAMRDGAELLHWLDSCLEESVLQGRVRAWLAQGQYAAMPVDEDDVAQAAAQWRALIMALERAGQLRT